MKVWFDLTKEEQQEVLDWIEECRAQRSILRDLESTRIGDHGKLLLNHLNDLINFEYSDAWDESDDGWMGSGCTEYPEGEDEED